MKIKFLTVSCFLITKAGAFPSEMKTIMLKASLESSMSSESTDE